MVKPLIDVKKLSFTYDNFKNIIEKISFDINPGEILCIIGPNGCGKTTLLNCLLGINKMQSGAIIIEGKELFQMSSVEMGKKISFVPQQRKNTFDYSVLEMVVMGRSAHISIFDSPSPKDIEIALKAIEMVGMLEFKDRSYNSLSGGEAQLVKFARALAQETNIMIFDEPTAHLDFYHELSIIKSISKLITISNKSIIMATHFPNQAFYFENLGIPTKVAIMNEGKFKAFGNPSETLNEKNMRDIFKMEVKIIKNNDKDSKTSYMIPLDFN